MDIGTKDVQEAAGSLHVCAGQELFQQDETEAVFLVDAENAFSSINRKAMLYNISSTCPILSTFVSKCYLVPTFYFRKQRNHIQRRDNARSSKGHGGLCIEGDIFNSFSAPVPFNE